MKTKPVHFTIPEAMVPYLLFAIWEVHGLSKPASVKNTAKGSDIEYEMSREDDNLVRKIMIDAWKNRDKNDLSNAILY